MSVSDTASFVCFVKKIKRMHKKKLEVKSSGREPVERKQYSKKRSLMKRERENGAKEEIQKKKKINP